MELHGQSFFSSTFFSSTLVSLTSLTFAFPCFGFMKQKQEQQGHWNKNFIVALLVARSQIPGQEGQCVQLLGPLNFYLSFFLCSIICAI
ncbi:hypothetical protein JHK87_034649 [Glycine soja]|nr:hypothetical protein JHK87_034649 [Glycine soja]